MAEGLVVGENDELPTLQHELDVSDRCVDGQELPVEGAVVGLSWCQLL